MISELTSITNKVITTRNLEALTKSTTELSMSSATHSTSHDGVSFTYRFMSIPNTSINNSNLGPLPQHTSLMQLIDASHVVDIIVDGSSILHKRGKRCTGRELQLAGLPGHFHGLKRLQGVNVLHVRLDGGAGEDVAREDAEDLCAALVGDVGG